MYWPEEDCVSVVAFSCISDPCPPAVGKPCRVGIGKKWYTGVTEDWYVSTALLYSLKKCAAYLAVVLAFSAHL